MEYMGIHTGATMQKGQIWLTNGERNSKIIITLRLFCVFSLHVDGFY